MEYDDETSEISEVLALPNIFQVADSVADCIIEKTLEQKRKRQEEEREIITDHKVFNIEKGQIYKDRKILKTAVGFFAMINNFQFKTKRSEPREYMVTCADDNCNWFLRASKLKSTSTFKVIAITTIQYQVKVQEKGDFTINILERTCSCRRFQLDEIPCSHAIAVFAKRGLRAYDYVADYYKIATMKATYERTVHPLPNEREWTIPESIERIVWPPKSRKPARRPRKKRLRSKGEPKVVLKFTRCGKVGHN
ncbi:hypothetical protein G4B88_023426 [Cannabis sativa]|uniref:SWIM-type domain-containing protein n=1 Tax=Cannabis sativa TaxID=3483 RepID=A0A7J6DN65_CANSA|nr:hypothetical protein G4B88_023426 [Cannabis sativa]